MTQPVRDPCEGRLVLQPPLLHCRPWLSRPMSISRNISRQPDLQKYQIPHFWGIESQALYFWIWGIFNMEGLIYAGGRFRDKSDTVHEVIHTSSLGIALHTSCFLSSLSLSINRLQNHLLSDCFKWRFYYSRLNINNLFSDAHCRKQWASLGVIRDAKSSRSVRYLCYFFWASVLFKSLFASLGVIFWGKKKGPKKIDHGRS